MDDAADALLRHANSVDRVKESIFEAENFVGHELDDALRIARHAIEVVKHVAEADVTTFMRILSTVASTAQNTVQVAVFTVFGAEVSRAHVDRASAIARAVPARPASGSADWLNVRSVLAGFRW